MSSILQDASDDLRERRGIDLATARRMADDAYARRDKVGDQLWQLPQPDWKTRALETRRGLDR